jgi:uncharacterized membrane protein
MILELLATFSSGLFTGASIYINLVEHPARMSCGSTLAVTEFAPSYKRAAIMQALLAIVGFLCAVTVWLFGSPWPWLVGGVLLGTVVPFTFLAIFPTNKQLLNPALDKDSALATQLLIRWGYLHAVRSVLSLASFVIFLWVMGAK